MRWGSKAKNDDIRYIIKYAWYPFSKPIIQVRFLVGSLN